MSEGRVRVELYSAAGAKLNFPPLLNVLSCEYGQGLHLIGHFRFDMPADDEAAANLSAGQQAWIYVKDEGLVFKGIIDEVTQAVADGGMVAHVAGSSLTRQLVWENTLLGREFDDVTLSSAASTLLTNTGWSSGSIGTPTRNLYASMDGVSIWQALGKVADQSGFHLREDLLNTEIDINAFGSASGVRFMGFEEAPVEMDDKVIPIQDIRHVAHSRDVWNKVVVIGQREGIGTAALTLGDAATIGDKQSFSANTTHNVAMPATVSADDLLLIIFLSDTAATHTTPSGWTLETSDLFFTNFGRVSVFSKKAAGTEGGTTVNVATSASATGLAHVYHLLEGTWSEDLANIEAGTWSEAGFGAADPNPPSVTPSWGDAAPTMFIPLYGASSNFDENPGAESGPAGYGGLASNTVLNATTRRLGLASAFKVTSTDSAEDPGAFASLDGGTGVHTSNTLAIRMVTQTSDEYDVRADIGPDGGTYFYIEDDASVTTYRRRTKVLQMKDVTRQGLSDDDKERAGNALLGLASKWLTQHKDELNSYEVTPVGMKHIVSGTPQFQVGDTIKVVYRGIVERWDTTRAWLSIDADLYVMTYTRSLTDAGDNWKFTVSDVPRQITDDGTRVAMMLEEMFSLQSTPYPAWIFGSDKLRLDSLGIQVSVQSSDHPILSIAPTFSADAATLDATYPRMKIIGFQDPTHSRLQLQSTHSADSFSSFDIDDQPGTKAQATLGLTYDHSTIGGVFGTMVFEGNENSMHAGFTDNMFLWLGGRTSDPNSSLILDGMMWYRDDLDQMRVRINGTTRQLDWSAV